MFHSYPLWPLKDSRLAPEISLQFMDTSPNCRNC